MYNVQAKILVCMLIGETHFGSQEQKKCFKTSFPPRLGGVSGMYNVHVYHLHLEQMCLSHTCTYKLDECLSIVGEQERLRM